MHTRIQRKLFHLRKIRKYLNQFASLQVYKQTILPLIDYCGFLVMSGNKNKYSALQVIQNDALQACMGYYTGYEMSQNDLHTTALSSVVYTRDWINNFL